MSFFKSQSGHKGYPSDHFDGKQFFNPWNKRSTSYIDLLRWRMTARPRPWPKNAENNCFDIPPARVEGSELRLSFVGHSTVLLQTQGLNILTDPVWAASASPFSWLKVPRVHQPGIVFENLPKIDIVLVSHNHYDHLDQETLRKLWLRDKPLIVTPLGNEKIIKNGDPEIGVVTLDWDESYTVDASTKIHVQPAQHWSRRGLWDTDKALWGSFVLETKSGLIYFAGDTGYGEHFRMTKSKFGKFRLALLPIGAYEPRWFLSYAHMGPEDAVRAYHDLDQPYALAIHISTFRLSDESYEDPRLSLAAARLRHTIPDDKFKTLDIGQTWFVP